MSEVQGTGQVVSAQGPTVDELRLDFDLSLAAQKKSKQSRTTYGTAVRQLGEFLAEKRMPTEVASIAREHVEAYLDDLLAVSVPGPSTPSSSSSPAAAT